MDWLNGGLDNWESQGLVILEILKFGSAAKTLGKKYGIYARLSQVAPTQTYTDFNTAISAKRI